MEKFGKEDSISYSVDDDGILTIKIDTTKELGPSASGKTTLIASSGGNAKINIGNELFGDRIVSLGLNFCIIKEMAMAANYTDEQVEMMRERYQAKPTRETVENLAEELNKSIKSIIGKLSREGIYQKAIYKQRQARYRLQSLS